MKAIRAATLGLALAAPAAAQDTLPDEVSDGMYITLAEVRANSLETFRFFAGPEGGPIARATFVDAQLPDHILPDTEIRPLLERLFSELDVNANGYVSLTEWRDRLDKDLGFADENGDGRITLKELSNARENMGFGDALGMIF